MSFQDEAHKAAEAATEAARKAKDAIDAQESNIDLYPHTARVIAILVGLLLLAALYIWLH